MRFLVSFSCEEELHLNGGKEGVGNLRGAYRIVIKTESKVTFIRDAPLAF